MNEDSGRMARSLPSWAASCWCSGPAPWRLPAPAGAAAARPGGAAAGRARRCPGTAQLGGRPGRPDPRARCQPGRPGSVRPDPGGGRGLDARVRPSTATTSRAAQYAADVRTLPAEVAQVSSVLRGQGLTRGRNRSRAAPCSRSAARSPPSKRRSGRPSIGAGARRGAGARQHVRPLRTGHPAVSSPVSSASTGWTRPTTCSRSAQASPWPRGRDVGSPVPPPAPDDRQRPGPCRTAHAAVPQACSTASSARPQPRGVTPRPDGQRLRPRPDVRAGPYRRRADDRHRRVRAVRRQRRPRLPVCYGLTNPIRNVAVDGGATGPARVDGEAALDIELAAVERAVVVARRLRGAERRATPQASTSSSASPVTTPPRSSRPAGATARPSGSSDIAAGEPIFGQMAAEGQTMIAASGDSARRTASPTAEPRRDRPSTTPGRNPTSSASGGDILEERLRRSPDVWNDCRARPPPVCATASSPASASAPAVAVTRRCGRAPVAAVHDRANTDP